MAEIFNFKFCLSHDWTMHAYPLLIVSPKCTIGSTEPHECTCSSHACTGRSGSQVCIFWSIPPNEVIGDYDRGRCLESESE